MNTSGTNKGTEIYENVIVLTDGYESYLFNTDMGYFRTCELDMSQMHLKAGCRLVECNSKSDVIHWVNKYIRNPIEDKSNWEFFADE